MAAVKAPQVADPWALIGGPLASGLGKGLGDAIGGGGPFMGGDSKATYGDVSTDHSGWTINVGSGSAATDNRQTKPVTRTTTDASIPAQMGLPVGNGGVSYVGASSMAGLSMAGINPLMLLAFGGLLLVAAKRKGRG